MVYAIVCTQGHMGLKEIREECGTQKWIPLLVVRGTETIVPVFDHFPTFKRFVEKNVFGKQEVGGWVGLTERDVQWLAEKGIKIKHMRFPGKVKGEFDIEILEYDPDHEMEIKGPR